MSKVIRNVIILFVLIFFVCATNIYALSMDIEDIVPQENPNQETTTDNPDGTNDQTVSVDQNNEGVPNQDNGEFPDATQDATQVDDAMEVMDESLTPTVTSNPTTSAEADLGLTNILNILLIVVGFVLILLGIAIIIRLRH